MLSPADRIVEATLPYTLRPKGNDREKVIAAALEFVILEYSYTDGEGEDLIDVRDLQELIDELKSTVTIEEPSQDLTTDAQDAL
jgi:predicted RNA-binding protein with EMAP domain